MKVKMAPLLFLLLGLGSINMSCENNSTDSIDQNAALVKLSILTRGQSSFQKTAIENIKISTAQVVISGIEFESEIEDSNDFELEQPFIQNLMSTDTMHKIQSISIPFGIYEEIEIEIDRLKAEDGQIYFENPDLQDISIRLEGYLDGDPVNEFIFTSELEVDQEIEFDEPLILDENSPTTNVVLRVDLSVWFIDANGNFIDPGKIENRSLIENNIQTSFEIYEDKDDDGEPDDADGDDDDNNYL